MKTKYLKLSIGSLTVTLTDFANNQIPRIDADGQDDEISITAAGSTTLYGLSRPRKALWDVNAYCTEAEYDTICLIRAESDYVRRSGSGSYILVEDTIKKFRERGSRTRAIVAGTSEIVQSPYTLYYAQYRAHIPAEPEGVFLGAKYQVSFTLIELDPVPI